MMNHSYNIGGAIALLLLLTPVTSHAHSQHNQTTATTSAQPPADSTHNGMSMDSAESEAMELEAMEPEVMESMEPEAMEPETSSIPAPHATSSVPNGLGESLLALMVGFPLGLHAFRFWS